MDRKQFVIQAVEEKKDLTKRFKGSANQRTIDVQASLREGKVVILEGFE